jgi:dipeptidyl aminopeptidase/acylaminoacyl peptidase
LIALRSLAVCIVVCAVMTVPAAVAAAAFPGANGRIAYQESRFKDRRHGGPAWRWSFWSRRPDGTRPLRIVRHATALNFSADGRRVVFTRAGGIGLARANGHDRSWLLGHAPRAGDGYSGWAAFSPDGGQVAFTVEDAEPYGTNSYVIGIDGTNPRLIAEHARLPMFSPDGARIAYVKNLAPGESEAPGSAIETVAVDGTDRRRIVEYSEPSAVRATTHPLRMDFAPDGTRLAVVEHSEDHDVSRIAIINARTGDRKRLPAHVTGHVRDAVWSPEGRRIAFIVWPGYPDSTHPVFTIRPDGTGKRRAFTVRVPTPGYIDALAWQPRPQPRAGSKHD